MQFAASSHQSMLTLPVRNTSRSLSPTSLVMWSKSSDPAMPCWIVLITANSALRCSVSLSSRCVSSNRRAFSKATARLPVSVSSRRTSASVKASNRSTFWMLT